MTTSVGAKSTKPGSKAAMRRPSTDRPPRVPVGALHVIDLDSQPSNASMFTAVCGEGALVCIDNSWDDDLPNERCNECSNHAWMASFSEMQNELLR